MNMNVSEHVSKCDIDWTNCQVNIMWLLCNYHFTHNIVRFFCLANKKIFQNKPEQNIVIFVKTIICASQRNTAMFHSRINQFLSQLTNYPINKEPIVFRTNHLNEWFSKWLQYFIPEWICFWTSHLSQWSIYKEPFVFWTNNLNDWFRETGTCHPLLLVLAFIFNWSTTDTSKVWTLSKLLF